MLYAAHYSRGPTHGHDGETYHFSAKGWGRHYIAGYTWSPDPETQTGKLVKLTELMSDYCHDAEPETLDALSLHATAFRKELDNSERSIEVVETSDIDS